MRRRMVYKYYSIRSGGEDEMVDRGPLNQKQTSKEKKKKKNFKGKKKHKTLQNKLRMWNFIAKTTEGSTQVE